MGFEPTIRFPVYTLSKRAPSATRPSLRARETCNIATRFRVTTRAARPTGDLRCRAADAAAPARIRQDTRDLKIPIPASVGLRRLRLPNTRLPTQQGLNPMRVDRRIFLSGFAAALVMPRRASAATVTDATGRTITAPDHVTRVYPAGPPAAVTLYTLAPDLLMGWLEPLGPRSTRVSAARNRRAAEAAADHRPRRCRQSRPRRHRAQARSHRRYRQCRGELRGARRQHRAKERHSLRVARRPFRPGRRDLPRSRQADRAQRRRREARALRRDDHRDRQPTQRRRAEREAAEGLLCARQERPADRPRQVDDQRVDRVHRRAQRCRRAARLPRRRDDRRRSRLESRRSSSPATRNSRRKFAATRIGPQSARSNRAASICRRSCRSAGPIFRRRSTG